MIIPIILISKAFAIVISAGFGIMFLKWLKRYIYNIRVFGKIKGFNMLPLIGSVHLIKSREEFFKQACDMCRTFKDEPVLKIWFGWRPVIVFHKSDLIDVLFTSSAHTKKPIQYSLLQPWLGNGVLLKDGDAYQARRRIITPSFHFEILDDFLIAMNEHAEILVDILSEMNEKNQEIDILSRIKLCAFDSFCETALGQHFNAQKNEVSEYLKATEKITELIGRRMNMPLYWSDFIYNLTPSGREQKKCLKILHSFTAKLVMDRNTDFEHFDLSSHKRMAFLDTLLKAKRENPSITFNDIREEVDTFMLGGLDTISLSTSWACQMIGSHPEVQKKLHEEIDKILGSSNRPLTSSDLHELKYLDLVIKESLRMNPPIPFFARLLTEDVQIGDFKLLKGEAALVFPYMIHRDEKYFPNPEIFDPERFLLENSKDRATYAYIPFSAGRRSCIGSRYGLMETKLLLATIFRKFELKALKKTEELNPVAEVSFHPFSGIPVELKLRHT